MRRPLSPGAVGSRNRGPSAQAPCNRAFSALQNVSPRLSTGTSSSQLRQRRRAVLLHFVLVGGNQKATPSSQVYCIFVFPSTASTFQATPPPTPHKMRRRAKASSQGDAFFRLRPAHGRWPAQGGQGGQQPQSRDPCGSGREARKTTCFPAGQTGAGIKTRRSKECAASSAG